MAPAYRRMAPAPSPSPQSQRIRPWSRTMAPTSTSSLAPAPPSKVSPSAPSAVTQRSSAGPLPCIPSACSGDLFRHPVSSMLPPFRKGGMGGFHQPSPVVNPPDPPLRVLKKSLMSERDNPHAASDMLSS